MTRYARVHVPGGLYHVICRFHDRHPHLDQPGARPKYLALLGQSAEKHDIRVLAYCLMSTHVHLVMQLGGDRLGRFTKAVNTPFGNWLNRERRGLGAVFADRPRSVLVHEETYGWELIRYVHNNPVRAGLAERAAQSAWSSHRAYLGLEPPPPWLAVDAVLGPDGPAREPLRAEFARFVDEGRADPRRPEFSGEMSRELRGRMSGILGGTAEFSAPVLGPDDFVKEAYLGAVEQRRDRLSMDADLDLKTLGRSVSEALGLAPGLLGTRTRIRTVSRARALVAWLWVERLGRSQIAVAQAFAVAPSAVAGMLGRLREHGVSLDEATLLDQVLRSLAHEPAADEPANPRAKSTADPQFFLLRRQR